ncbi:hypothetical protein [Rosistilla oblonga]|nr:hypothetical protein [Rosistilla oblonga]
MALSMLLEGMSIRATARITNIDQNTIGNLILTAGEQCGRLLDSISGISVTDIQIDEIWTFVGMKQRTANLRNLGDDSSVGDNWTYIAVERYTKMVLAHHVGRRDTNDTNVFLGKVRRAIDASLPFQVSTDGLSNYRYGVPFALGSNANFGMLIKKYAAQQQETRYSPAAIIGTEKKAVFGSPDPDSICTSHIETLNQKIRMHLRRFTRLTAGHSKSVEHHVAMQNIFFAWYNWCRKHHTLRQTPAMECGIAMTKWSIRELLESSATC